MSDCPVNDSESRGYAAKCILASSRELDGRLAQITQFEEEEGHGIHQETEIETRFKAQKPGFL